MTRWWLTTCAVLLSSAEGWSASETQQTVFPKALEVAGKPTELRLAARTLSYQPMGEQQCAGSCPSVLRLSGAVRLVVGGFALAADHAELLLEGGGRLRRATARGGVKFRFAAREGSSSRRRGRARRAELSVKPSLVVELSGDAELSCEELGLFLRGSRIALDLASGRAVVHEARAELRERRGNRGGREGSGRRGTR